MTNKNEMPELKAGMVVEIEIITGSNYGQFLYVTDKLVVALDGDEYQPITEEGVRVIKVYAVCAGMAFNRLTPYIAKQTPIWTRQSTEKTEALAKLEDMQAEVDELKTIIEGME
ncbi:MAG: hypothetical protein GY941_22370 [Planctomycetes bacterium]|nr:hypothetical protein [Planctomycetota bacterium]